MIIHPIGVIWEFYREIKEVTINKSTKTRKNGWHKTKYSKSSRRNIQYKSKFFDNGYLNKMEGWYR